MYSCVLTAGIVALAQCLHNFAMRCTLFNEVILIVLFCPFFVMKIIALSKALRWLAFFILQVAEMQGVGSALRRIKGIICSAVREIPI